MTRGLQFKSLHQQLVITIIFCKSSTFDGIFMCHNQCPHKTNIFTFSFLGRFFFCQFDHRQMPTLCQPYLTFANTDSRGSCIKSKCTKDTLIYRTVSNSKCHNRGPKQTVRFTPPRAAFVVSRHGRPLK